MINFKVDKEGFDRAFERLNFLLIEKDITIDVKAVGGYAMIRNGIRNGEDGYSEDVDSATEDWEPEVINLIEIVAKEQNLVNDWLNNDPIKLPEVNEVIDELVWIDDKRFSNINLKWADVDSTFLLKVRAFEGGGLVPRKTDKMDLFKFILYLNDIKDFDSLLLKYNFIMDYPRCMDFLKGYDFE